MDFYKGKGLFNEQDDIGPGFDLGRIDDYPLTAVGATVVLTEVIDPFLASFGKVGGNGGSEPAGD